ncbi:M56 family metallopeptidase [Lentisphaerota bacterium ZTH]|nr:M56 family metallopeptidase [Lentisphaerota bacterium]WET07113.1 M56 family metallopeptidase [Lentisphaerota bacterium ZTH]
MRSVIRTESGVRSQGIPTGKPAVIATVSEQIPKKTNRALSEKLNVALLVNCFGVIWLAGFLAILMKLFYSLVFLRGFKAASFERIDGKFLAIMHEVIAQIKFKPVPRIIISQAAESPVMLGISNLTILIPKKLYESITEDEFRSILFHEFAHIVHKDHLYNILNNIILAMNWWNPLVYYISTEQDLAREDICDNCAIKGMKSAEVYSSCLVNLAEKVCLISKLPATAGMAGRKSGLEKRIKSIMSKEREMLSTVKKSIRLSTCLLCLALTCFVSGISISAVKAANKVRPEEQKPSELEEKLSKLVKNIPVENVPAATFFRYLAEKYKINMLLAGLSQQTSPKITLNLTKSQPLKEVISLACKVAGLHCRIDRSVVLISRKPLPEKFDYVKTKNAQAVSKNAKVLLTRQKLDKIIFARISFDDAGVLAVISYLSRRSKRNDPDKKGISVCVGFDKTAVRRLPDVTMHLKDLSMADILKYLCLLGNLQMEIDGDNVILSQK